MIFPWLSCAIGKWFTALFVLFSVLIPPCTAFAQGARADVVITFGGDVNFARSRTTPVPGRVTKFGTISLNEATSALRPFWQEGDVNFINVETVVAARDGNPQGKTFVFRSHPEQLRYLMDQGVNAFALANNHAWDHGQLGFNATHSFFDLESRLRPLLYAGIGDDITAFLPRIFAKNGMRIALSALSFGGGPFKPGPNRFGMASLSDTRHVDLVLEELKRVDADIKLLSVHWGTENQTSLDYGQRELVQRAWKEAGVHLVIGHHPHVVRGVEMDPGGNHAAFYSLGNFLFIGGAAKDSDAVGRDYGLLGKAYFRKTEQGVKLMALGAVPLKGVHMKPRLMARARFERTIANLNRRSQLDMGQGGADFQTLPGDPEAVVCFHSEKTNPAFPCRGISGLEKAQQKTLLLIPDLL